MIAPAKTSKTLAWTGERMVPHQSDLATELYHWQRYLYFKPWYVCAKVCDAASGEGYGTNFAGAYAESSTGFDIGEEAVAHAAQRYPNSKFQVQDVCGADYSEFDVVVSFETIEHLPDPVSFLQALKSCSGRIVISTPNRKTHSPGNGLADKPLNQFHTVEWTPLEFAALIREQFADREVRFLSQEAQWPGLIREGLDDEAMYCIAVIGEGALPVWPSLGIAIPTCDNFGQLQDAMLGISRYYPGRCQFAVTGNGTSGQHLSNLRDLQTGFPQLLHVIESSENLGYALGCNAGLDYLWQEGWFDYFGVCNDDVLPTPATLIEMVDSFRELEKLGHKPGAIGPCSNRVAGAQQVDVGGFQDLVGMFVRAENFHRERHSGATEAPQVRGLFLLIHPDCLSAVGGFDPRYGRGNFEDDDFNLRCRLAGFTNWIADGAFLYHHGSQTFKNLGADYAGSIERNQQIFQWKWDLMKAEEWPMLDSAPEGVELFVPLTAKPMREFPVQTADEEICLFNEASDMEFVAWIHQRMRARPRTLRREIVELLMRDAA